MTIRFKEIIRFLEDHTINFTIFGNVPDSELRIASVFTPIASGFYYLLGNTLELNTKKSVILTKSVSGKGDQKNTYIVIEEDPQEVFYCILDFYFGRRSSGEISSHIVLRGNVSIGSNVEIGPFCDLEDCLIGDNVIIGSSCKIYPKSIIGNNSIVESGCIIGAQGVAWMWSNEFDGRIVLPQLGGVKIGSNCFVGAQTVIVRGSLNENTEIGDYAIMAPGGRIGHGTKLGKYIHFANGVITGGNSSIGDYAFIGSGAVLRPKVKICEHTIVGAGSVVVKDQEVPGMTLMGVPAKEFKTKEFPSGMPRPKNS